MVFARTGLKPQQFAGNLKGGLSEGIGYAIKDVPFALDDSADLLVVDFR